ncbi:FAD-binding oxidoreductase [Georgenia subflava]|uniref:FAD-binding protein n=1 Tax=Georgenia subflava TaxID=1622177 RepID=A0A6N7ENL0_9MICO|nr:FAD-binding protein [Georgenia subflava]MPV38457.1 FAD-binding protein [Georgenia subflava]
MTGTPRLDVDFSALQDRLTGRVHLPGEDSYTALTTPWNLAVQPTPSAVVAVADAADIGEVLRFAATVGLPVAVQSTGHGIVDNLDGALLVHVGALDECTVHPEGWARVGAGVKWQTVLDAAAVHGLAALVGSAPDVGVVGYTTGGGIGPVARTWGAASDRVRAVDVVTGDGVVRRATATEEPDLFWGLRGGKGALGVVTAVEFDLVEQPEIYGGGLYFDSEHTTAVLHSWRTWCEDLPPEATTSLALLNLPDGVPGVPPPLAGRFSVAVRFVWTGDHRDGARVLAPIRAVAEPIIDAVGPLPFSQIGFVHSDPVDPLPVHESSHLLNELPGEAVDALLAVAGPGTGSPQLMVEIRQLGGALARPGPVSSALCQRDAAFSVLLIGVPAPPIAEAVLSHAAMVAEVLAPWTTGGRLPNFGADAGVESFARCYDAPTMSRLTDLAERYDPHSLFRVGHVPARTPATAPRAPVDDAEAADATVRTVSVPASDPEPDVMAGRAAATVPEQETDLERGTGLERETELKRGPDLERGTELD